MSQVPNREFNFEISKLPKWAQAYIADLQRQRDTAVEALKTYIDNQTPSRIFTENLICINNGAPEFIKAYVQANEVTFDLDKNSDVRENRVNVRIDQDDPAQVLISAAWNQISLHPIASNMIALKGTRS